MAANTDEIRAVTHVFGSPEDVWAILMDRSSWAAWWPTDLVPPVEAKAVEPAELDLAPDPAGSTRGFALREGLLLGTMVTIWRRGPDQKRRERKKEEARLSSIAHGLELLVLRRTLARGVPNVPALKAAGDVDGLVSALRHPEAWVRRSAGMAIPPKDPRTWDGLLEAASDESPEVRRMAQMHLHLVDDPRAEEALARMRDDPDPRISKEAESFYRMWQRGSQVAAGRRIHQTYQSLFGPKPGEPFLGSKLGVLMTDVEALDAAVGATMLTDAPIAIHPRVVFPPLCSGCLEPTARLATHLAIPTWEFADHTLRRTVRTPPIEWGIPLCERCEPFGLVHLTRIGGHYAPGSKESAFWVGFRFANVAYLGPFAEANGLPRDTRVMPTTLKLAAVGRAEQKPRDLEALQTALDWWAHVRDGLGLHRYVELKRQLLDLEAGTGGVADVRSLQETFSVTPEQLRDVERIAQRRFRILETLGG